MSKTDFQNGFALGMASGGVVEVNDLSEIDDLIDQSGVLDSTEGTATEKVEQLIDKANSIDISMYISNAANLFKGATTFPKNATINLPNATDTSLAFATWETTPIPIVEELTVNAPKTKNIQQMFWTNHGVRKVILNAPDTPTSMFLTFGYAEGLTELTLNFSTKNVTNCERAFINCSKLIKIIGVLDFSKVTNVWNMFSNCNGLEEVTFEPNTISLSILLAQSSKLTNESVQSIIDGLKALEEGASAKTLTLNKAIVLTDEQKATINEKGWTLAQ